MSDHGLPTVDGAQACPFVAFENDRDERATSPDHRHRCYAETRPAPRALAHQEAYCLSSRFPVCPTFQDWARREAAHPLPGGGVESAAGGELPERNPPRDWSAPPSWAGAAGGAAAGGAPTGGAATGGAAAGAAGVASGFDDEDDEDDDRDEEPPGFLSSRSAAAGAGLAGSAADRLAGSGRDPGDVTDEARYGPTSQPDHRPAARIDPAGDPDDDYGDEGREDDDFESERPGRPRSARASGGIGFGRDRRPRVGATRRAQGWHETGPSWEQPRHNEPYPALKPRGGLRISRVGGMAIALVLAAVGLFFLPQLLGLGSSPGTGDGTSPRPGSGAPAGSVAPTAVPAPTPQVYIVKSGDSMFSIAKQFGLTPDELIEANRETHPNPDQLQIGDQLVIPTKAPDELGGSPSPSGP